MMGTAVAVSWYWLIAVAPLGGYFVYSAVMEERYMTDPLPRRLSRLQALNQDAHSVHLLTRPVSLDQSDAELGPVPAPPHLTGELVVSADPRGIGRLAFVTAVGTRSRMP